jgi:hypothetical protein
MAATDTGTRAGPRRRSARLSRCAALAVLGLTATAARAQRAGADPDKVRRVVLARVPADHPATLSGAVDKPLYLVFDGAVGRGTIRAPGVAIHRSGPNEVVLTPSRAATRGPVPVTVPLQTGVATFTLVLKPEASDQRVQVYRSGESWGPLSQRPQRPLIGALAVRPIQLERTNAAVPDAIVQCRMSLRVRTPVLPQGATVEIRTPDRSLCESANTLNMRVGGGR